ncbi:MAG TPA: M20/M25/M40 family metallo-hydrolase [Candidatus Acidoferrum sp.]|jgi:acetylornithine deacetylase|nr:M20/M25/M40 family metallo-hydrolase [Candidatus Acidoferrum sp.]
MKEDLANAILSQVREDEIVSMACDLVNIPSPTGEELEMGRYMRRAFEEAGLDVTWQEVEDGRANVVGLWEGAGNGKSLMFNGHMDTSNSGRETFLSGLGYKPKAVIRDGMIYGLGIYNMKGALVCYTEAVKALMRAGIMLEGDVTIAAVAGEIEKTQWSDEFVGKEYRGYGVGSHHLVNHGVLPDMCILGEPTDMQLVLGHYGTVWVRISTHGHYVHTAFTRGKQDQSSIFRLKEILPPIYEWIAAWEKRAVYDGQPGVVNVGCIRGGHPWRVSRTPDRADVFLDVRVPPTMPLKEVRVAIKQLVLDLRIKHPDYDVEYETFVSVPGAEISKDHPLVKTVEACHERVLGTPAKYTTVLWDSDASVMTRYGIETINYGPSSGPRDAEGEKVAIETLVSTAKVYALAAAEICGAR